MRVALATWFPRDPSAPRGGVEAVSVNLTRALARLPGTDIHVVAFDETINTQEECRWEGATIHRLPRTPGSLLAFSCGNGRHHLCEFLYQLKPDVVHAHDTFGIMTRGLTLPRVFTIHGFIHEDTSYEGGWKAKLRSELWKHTELSTWAEQPHIIAISPYVRERLRGVATGVLHDIENPIDPACFDAERGESPGRIFSAAVISSRKNTLGLVQAVGKLPTNIPLELRLAGPVVEHSYHEMVASYVRTHNLQGCVKMLGSVPGEVVRRELAAAAVFALVSFEEGAPMGIAEAMAAGVPILTSNRCGMPYMIRHGESGFLVNPDDPNDIRYHLLEILRDESLRHYMGRTARAFAAERFHPESVAKRTLRVYRRAIGNP